MIPFTLENRKRKGRLISLADIYGRVFWISWAKSRCGEAEEGELAGINMVNAAVKNLKEFSSTFKCPKSKIECDA